MSTGNSMEFGMSDNRTIFLGTSIGYYDANKNKTFRVLTEDDASSTGTLVSKKDADAAYLGKKGRQTVIGQVFASEGFFSSDEAGSINTPTGSYKVLFKQAHKQFNDGSPNDGVIIEYGDSEWCGQLLIPNNGNQPLYFRGWANNQVTPWKTVYVDTLLNKITFKNGAELWVE